MIRIKQSFDIVTEESASMGDFAETGWHDREGIEFDSISEAIEYLYRSGACHASSTHFYVGIWYSTEPDQDMHDGSWETRNFHVEASPFEERAIFNGLFQKRKAAV